MEYWLFGLFIICLFFIFIWISRKNRQDKEELQDKIIQSELKSEKKDENNNDSDSL